MINKAYQIYNLLSIKSILDNIQLLKLFQSQFSLYTFPELKIKLLYKYFIYNSIKSNKNNLQKYIKSTYSDFINNNNVSYYIQNISDQELTINRFFFEIQSKEKNNLNDIILNDNLNSSENLIINENLDLI